MRFPCFPPTRLPSCARRGSCVWPRLSGATRLRIRPSESPDSRPFPGFRAQDRQHSRRRLHRQTGKGNRRQKSQVSRRLRTARQRNEEGNWNWCWRGNWGHDHENEPTCLKFRLVNAFSNESLAYRFRVLRTFSQLSLATWTITSASASPFREPRWNSTLPSIRAISSLLLH